MSVVHAHLDQSSAPPYDTRKSPFQAVKKVKSAPQLGTLMIETLRKSLNKSEVLTPGSDLYAEKSQRWATSSERPAVS